MFEFGYLNHVIGEISKFFATTLGDANGRTLSRIMGDGLYLLTGGLMPRHGSTDVVHLLAFVTVVLGASRIVRWSLLARVAGGVFLALWGAGMMY